MQKNKWYDDCVHLSQAVVFFFTIITPTFAVSSHTELYLLQLDFSWNIKRPSKKNWLASHFTTEKAPNSIFFIFIVSFTLKNVLVLFCDCKTCEKSELVTRKLTKSAFQYYVNVWYGMSERLDAIILGIVFVVF